MPIDITLSLIALCTPPSREPVGWRLALPFVRRAGGLLRSRFRRSPATECSEPAERLRRDRGHPLPRYVGNEDVRAFPEDKTGQPRFKNGGEQAAKLFFVPHAHVGVGRSADPEAGMPAHGLVEKNRARDIDFFKQFSYSLHIWSVQSKSD